MQSRKAPSPPLELGAASQALKAVRQFQRCRELMWRCEHQAAQYPEGGPLQALELFKAQEHQARGELWLQALETWIEGEVMTVKHKRAITELGADVRRQLTEAIGRDIARLLEAQRSGAGRTELAAEMFGKWSAYTDETDVKGLLALKSELQRR